MFQKEFIFSRVCFTKAEHQRLIMSISKIIYPLGQRLVAASENTSIQAYVSDTQKKRFFSIFRKIINMSKQRALSNISLEIA